DVDTRDRAGHDKALDLAGALEDRVDLGVAVPALDRVLAQEARAAEDLYGLLGDGHRDLASLQLAHGALAAAERAVVAPRPGGPPDQQPGGVDLHAHVREGERDRLVLDDRAAELYAALRVLQRVLVGGARHAERLRADGRPGQLEGAHRGLALCLPPLARLG